MMRRPLMVKLAARRMSMGMRTAMAAAMTAEDRAEMSDSGMMITGSAIRARLMEVAARRGNLD